MTMPELLDIVESCLDSGRPYPWRAVEKYWREQAGPPRAEYAASWPAPLKLDTPLGRCVHKVNVVLAREHWRRAVVEGRERCEV